MLKKYPKREKIRDGTEVLIRLMVKEDQRALSDFFGESRRKIGCFSGMMSRSPRPFGPGWMG